MTKEETRTLLIILGKLHLTYTMDFADTYIRVSYNLGFFKEAPFKDNLKILLEKVDNVLHDIPLKIEFLELTKKSYLEEKEYIEEKLKEVKDD